MSKRAKAALAAVTAVAFGVSGVMMMNTDAGRMPAAVVLASETLVQPWEGRSLKAYQDMVGVWTICDGDTVNVTAGMVETPAGCDARLQRRMTREFYPALVSCVPGFESAPLSWQAMMLSLSWNIGWQTACRSTAAVLGRLGNFVESCNRAVAFNRAGGQVVIGLKRRREFGDAARIGEQELCLEGLQ